MSWRRAAPKPARATARRAEGRPVSAANRTAVRRLLAVALGASVLLLIALAVLIGRQLSVEALPPLTAQTTPPDPALIARGAYMARAGNCAACHTARGGQPYAGGRAIETPFGQVFAGNLTPDPEHGLGRWSADAFWRALHHGQSRDGRLLYPAFPYASFTQITREDSDALHAFLRSLPPVAQPNRPHALRFPYRTQAALAVWRALYFEPGSFQPDPAQPADWNRGAYLVRGLAHCAACHAPRDALGGVAAGQEFDGGFMAGQGWYAPSLRSRFEAGLAHWAPQDIVDLLKTGVAHGSAGAAMGPMAEVVFHSTQHLSDADLHAMATHLKSLGRDAEPPPPTAPRAAPAQLALGQRVYEAQCTDCHGAQGEGARQAYPPLAGNRALTLASPVNPVQAVLNGGFAPATAGNPRPYGMPPYRTLLSDAEIAAVITYVRQSWGNQAAAVSPLDVQRLR